MHQRDLAAEAGQEVGLLHGGIAAADDHDLLLAIEEAIAGGAGADAMADQFLLGGQIEPARFGAGSDDERAGFDPLAIEVQAERAFGEIGVDDFAIEIDGAETLGLLFHVLDEIGAVDAFGESGEVLDLGGQGQAGRRPRGL